MDSVWGANVSAVPPAIPADAPVGYPTDGSSTGGVSSTVPKAFWYYMLSQEILNAIKGGGLAFDRQDLSQLNKSIDKRIQEAVERIDQTIAGVVDKVAKVETTPAGAVMAFARQTAPSEYWLACDGRAVSRTSYPQLFAAIGTAFGAGNGSTTFNLPDLRGVVVRGVDSGRNLDPGRVFGTYQEDAIRNITAGGLGVNHVTLNVAGGLWGAFYKGAPIPEGKGNGTYGAANVCFDASRVVPTAAENRVKNVALTYFIHI